MLLIKQMIAEFVGTFWLVFAGIGSAITAAIFMQKANVVINGKAVETTFNIGIGFIGVAFAVGLTVMTMIYAFGHVSGGHFNPAVSLGLAAGGRFSPLKVVPYWIAQVGGAISAAWVLWFVANGSLSYDIGNFACNGYGDHSPGQYAMQQCFLVEALLTFFFLVIIMGATSKRAPAGFAGIAIGLGLTLIHLVGIPITNLSVNPARSSGTALVLLTGGTEWAFNQLWLFWAAPLLGGFVGGFFYRLMDKD
ncbi:MAG TPA: aquaporin Z [Gemmataceae bacterium]|jgi:aquaporin Z|nr:aquaporin Z [Gemmataceae bacterium]